LVAEHVKRLRLALPTLGMASTHAEDKLSVDRPYMTDSFGDVIAKEAPRTTGTLLVIATKRLDSRDFKAQLKAIDALSPELEDPQLLVAVAVANGTMRSGYWFAPAAARSLLGKEDFAVYLIGAHGTICSVSKQALSTERIRASTSECRHRGRSK
jgi:hypothetical protein